MLTSDAASFAQILILSTYNHCIHNIAHTDDQAAYTKGMRTCHYICDTATYGNDLYAFHRRLIRSRNFAHSSYKKHGKWLSDTKKYYLMSHDHAIDVVESLIRRFVTGGCDPDATFLKGFEV